MNKNIKIFFYTISITLVILRLLFIGNTLLIDDEAYYAMYARHLSWGYIDHGPVIGYLIYLFTIFGENSFTVRLSAIVMLIILSFVLYNFGKEHFSQMAGIAMSLGISANMLFHTNSVVVTPDVPLAFFSIMAIVYYYKAYFIHERYFIFVTIIPLCYFLFHSFFSRMEVNWPAPIFYGGIFLFGISVAESWPVLRKHFLFQIIFSVVLILTVTIQTFFPILPIKGKTDITNRYYIYNVVDDELKKYLEDNPELMNKRILADNYQIPSMINFYLNPDLEATTLSINYHSTLYSFLYDDTSFKGNDFLFLKRGKIFPDNYKPYFEDIHLLDILYSIRDKKEIASYSLWSVKNYKGKDFIK